MRISSVFALPALAMQASALAISGVLPLQQATAAMVPSDSWQCTPQMESAMPIPLSMGTPASQRTDKRTVSLNCIFNTPRAGSSLVTLCIAAPLGMNPDGVFRRVKSSKGNTLVRYMLGAEIGEVPSARPFNFEAITPSLQPLYSVLIESSAAGMQSFRHQFKIVSEFEPLTQRGLDAGSYGDMLSNFMVSIHEGDNCGTLLWGAPRDPLGELGNLSVLASLEPQCGFSVLANLDFGTLSQGVAGQKASGRLALSCLTNLPSVKISMGPGNQPSETMPISRMMKSMDGKAQVPYLIFKPDGTEWSQNGSMVPGSPLDIEGVDGLTVPIAGLIPADTPMPPTSDYSDSVVVTLDF